MSLETSKFCCFVAVLGSVTKQTVLLNPLKTFTLSIKVIMLIIWPEELPRRALTCKTIMVSASNEAVLGVS